MEWRHRSVKRENQGRDEVPACLISVHGSHHIMSHLLMVIVDPWRRERTDGEVREAVRS